LGGLLRDTPYSIKNRQRSTTIKIQDMQEERKLKEKELNMLPRVTIWDVFKWIPWWITLPRKEECRKCIERVH
jgi:hypothetical protein